ncbi:histone deacetylase 7-like isoform X2 [Myxocyprinus asiaticus]|nr:histone deacetylase 7-like isoform X2 [Myxocyprinus asiaticus]XP_051567630.1 histone deacetylase 7-like isoform X2 [Myxocyprinus asiaticus]
MSQLQHRRQERGRETEQQRKQSPNQLLIKKKSEQSAVASPWVKQKLQQHILSRLDQAATTPGSYLRKPSQDPHHFQCVSHYFGEDNPLRRTVSEPILKVRPKRSVLGRQNPLLRKTSAPPSVRASDAMGASPSTVSVSMGSSTPDKLLKILLDQQTYGAPISKELVSNNIKQAESHLHIGAQNPILLPVMPQGWVAFPHLQPLHPHVLTVHPYVLTVPEPCAVLSHRVLAKTQSAPSFIQHNTKIHRQSLTFTLPAYQQSNSWPQERIQQHTLPKKVLVRRVCSMSPEELHEKKSVEEENAKEGGHSLFESPFHNNCSNPLEAQSLGERYHQPNRMSHRNLMHAHSSPGYYTYNRTLPSCLTSPLSCQSIRNIPHHTTGLVYDSQMLKHECDCGENSNHPEHAGRIKSIWSRLQECGLRNQCERVKGRLASLKELQSIHSEKHVILFTELSETDLPNHMEVFQTQPCGGKGRDLDMVWNGTSSIAALKMAVGSVIELALHVAKGELRNGFAVVRPPGHHASHSQTHGFSIFNSVAIAAKQLQDRLNVKRILIVDWDVHHGSGTEKIFYTDPSVLYISLHRYDNGSFFPGTGGPIMVGSDEGKGYNVNVAWSGGLNPPMGDAEYLAAFRTVVMPIAHEFSPDMVLVSAGFDAAEGHPAALGGYNVSAKCFGLLTRKLMELAEGRVVLVLEGGYDLSSLCDASQACVNALVGYEPEPLAEEELLRRPCDNAVDSLETVLRVQSQYWSSVRAMLDTVSLPYVKAEKRYSVGSDAASALDGLTMTVSSRSRFPNEPMEHDEDDFM